MNELEARLRDAALARGLAQLRRATELALGYAPVEIYKAEAGALLRRLDELEQEVEQLRKDYDEGHICGHLDETDAPCLLRIGHEQRHLHGRPFDTADGLPP